MYDVWTVSKLATTQHSADIFRLVPAAQKRLFIISVSSNNIVRIWTNVYTNKRRLYAYEFIGLLTQSVNMAR